MDYIKENQFLVICHDCESGNYHNIYYNDVDSLTKYLNNILESNIKFIEEDYTTDNELNEWKEILKSNDINVKINFLKSDHEKSDIINIITTNNNIYYYKL